MLLQVAGPVVSAQTWLAVIHLTAGLVTGALAFVVVVALGVLGISTLWFFLVGLPVLVAALWLGLQVGRGERARFAVTLGEQIPAPPASLSPGAGRRGRMWRLLTSRNAWRHAAYALIRLPLSLAETAIVTAFWSFALAMVGLPLFAWMLIRLQWHATAALPHHGLMYAAVVLGVILLPVAAQVTRGLAAADVAVARYLIGPGSQADMTARIGALERSRAQAVGSADAERRRIERDLHDGAQQRLVAGPGAVRGRPGRGQGHHRPGPRGSQAGPH
jgi:signal transduction histidine kinase